MTDMIKNQGVTLSHALTRLSNKKNIYENNGCFITGALSSRQRG